ncbi:3-deoxy-7-phosphoheptulonate synthase [Dehalococcoidia bacterium]|nr:3-deoxy-7-phosphoheptulonate synthase [Dehalococcoidia bacterium]
MKKTIINLNNKIQIGGGDFVIMAGPCAAESEEQMLTASKGILKAGGHIFRSNFFKPRTLPNTFQGCGLVGFEWLKKIQNEVKIPTMIEVRTPQHIELALKYNIDLLWIGARNAQNFDLLIEIGRQTAGKRVPVLLKRGLAMKLKEWLGAADYIKTNGNPNVILCERGIVTFDPAITRNILDLQTAWVAKKESGLPVVIDPSHASGRRDLIIPMCLATKAAGLDGILIEVHPEPDKALTDKNQQISIDQFKKLIEKLGAISL